MAGLLSDIGNAIGGAVSWGEGVAAGIGQAVYGGATAGISAGQSGVNAIETGGASLLAGAGNTYNTGINAAQNFLGGGGGSGAGAGGAGGRVYVSPPVATPNVVSPISSTGIAPAINLATLINPIVPVAALGLSAGGILGGLTASQKPQGLQQENLTELTPQPAKVQSPSTTNPFASIVSGISDIFGGGVSPAKASDIPSVNIGFGTITGNQNYPTLAAAKTANNLLASELANLPAPYIASPKTPSDVTTFVPYGNYAQTAIPNTKVVYEPGGEADIYQEIFNPGGTPFWNLISSGSRNALQSGMFTIEKPETPLVYTQPGAAAGSLSSYANPAGAAKVLASPVNYSELGSEVYGGYVLPLSGKTVQGTSASLSTYSNPYNLANLVSPTAVNESKTQLPDISAPWSISNKSPVLQELNIGGLTKAYLPGTDLGDITPAVASILGSGGKSTQQQGGLTFSLLSNLGMALPSSKSSTVLVPSEFDLWASGLNIPVVSGALVASSDFMFSGSNPIAGTVKTAGMGLTGRDLFSRFDETTTIGAPITDKSTNTSTVTTTTTMTPVQGGFEVGNQVMGNKLESIVPSFIKAWYNTPDTYSGNPFISSQGTFGIFPDYSNAFAKGAVKNLVENPATALMNLGIGGLMAGGGELLAGAAGAATLSAEGAAAAEGAGWGTRAAGAAAPYLNTFITKLAPTALVTLYGASVAGRSTDWGTDFSPAAASRLGGIFSTEIAPMILGGELVANRGAIASSAKNIYSGIDDAVYSFHQNMMGIENIGVGGGRDIDTAFNDYSSYSPATPKTPSGFGGGSVGLGGEELKLLPDLSTPIKPIYTSDVISGGEFVSTSPPAKILDFFRELSPTIKPGSPEVSYLFDIEGNVIASKTGNVGTVELGDEYYASTLGKQIAYEGHTHTYDSGRYGNLPPPILLNYPSPNDLFSYGKTSSESVLGQFVVSNEAISYLPKPESGWAGAFDKMLPENPNAIFEPTFTKQLVEDYGLQITKLKSYPQTNKDLGPGVKTPIGTIYGSIPKEYAHLAGKPSILSVPKSSYPATNYPQIAGTTLAESAATPRLPFPSYSSILSTDIDFTAFGKPVNPYISLHSQGFTDAEIYALTPESRYNLDELEIPFTSRSKSGMDRENGAFSFGGVNRAAGKSPFDISEEPIPETKSSTTKYPSQELNLKSYNEGLQPQTEMAAELSSGPSRNLKYAESNSDFASHFEDMFRKSTLKNLERPVATAKERAMAISQYNLTPEEISVAKSEGLSLNDILKMRSESTTGQSWMSPDSELSSWSDMYSREGMGYAPSSILDMERAFTTQKSSKTIFGMTPIVDDTVFTSSRTSSRQKPNQSPDYFRFAGISEIPSTRSKNKQQPQPRNKRETFNDILPEFTVYPSPSTRQQPETTPLPIPYIWKQPPPPPPKTKKTVTPGQLFGIPPGASTPGGLMAVQHGKYATPWIETIKLNRLL